MEYPWVIDYDCLNGDDCVIQIQLTSGKAMCQTRLLTLCACDLDPQYLTMCQGHGTLMSWTTMVISSRFSLQVKWYGLNMSFGKI